MSGLTGQICDSSIILRLFNAINALRILLSYVIGGVRLSAETSDCVMGIAVIGIAVLAYNINIIFDWCFKSNRIYNSTWAEAVVCVFMWLVLFFYLLQETYQSWRKSRFIILCYCKYKLSVQNFILNFLIAKILESICINVSKSKIYVFINPLGIS